MASALAHAQVAIEAVTGRCKAELRLSASISQALAAVPSGFSIQSPRAIVDINQGNLRSRQCRPGGDRTRVVLNLKQATAYKRPSCRASRCWWCLTTRLPAWPASPGQPRCLPPRQQPRQHCPADLDFRRGADGAGRVIVALPATRSVWTSASKGQSLVVEFLRRPARHLRRRLDVTDFGTPVQTVTTFQSGDRVRMVIEPRGNWEHSAYQSDNQFVLSKCGRVKVDPNKLTQGPGYSGEKLS
jgi:type IV pilus assembly protein PilQ